MSLIPFILDLADELHEFSRCLANGIDINDFGFGLYTGTDPQQHQQQQQQQQQQHQPQTSPRRSRTSSFSSFWMPSKRHHPYNRIKTACCAKTGEEAVANPEKSDASSSSIGGTPGKSASYSVVNKNGFQVSMNVKQFAPNELSVKTIDNCIVVEGRHDDKEDGHGVISRHFVRKYMLPKGYDPNDVLSTLSSDGILTVKAPPPPPPAAKNDEANERVIEIQPTPGPTPVMVVSAEDTPAKETTKKLATTSLARSECQLPEAKRQKLDLPPEPEPEESTEAAAPTPPPPPATTSATTENETDLDSVPTAEAAAENEFNDVEMEKADEEISEKNTEQQEQQTSDVAVIENDVEKKSEIIEKEEKLLEKEQEQEQKIGDETENELLGECISESNGGDSKNLCEKMEESCNVADTAEATEKSNKTPNESTKIEENAEDINNKMDVDGDNEEGHNDDDEKMDNTENVVATNKTADSDKKTTIKAAANDEVSAKNTDDTDTSSSKTTKTTNTNNKKNSNKNSSNTSTTTTTTTATTINNSSPDDVTENSVKDVKGGNGVVTGEIPVDIPNSVDSDADTTTTTKKTKGLADDNKAESVADIEAETETDETAVLCTDTTKGIIDDVALLKVATADPTAITDNTDGNVILTESIDDITTTELSTTGAATTVDTVECSLFAKKTHLGNGTNTTATPLVGTEEMAN